MRPARSILQLTKHAVRSPLLSKSSSSVAALSPFKAPIALRQLITVDESRAHHIDPVIDHLRARVAKCLTYGTNPREKEIAMQILAKINEPTWYRLIGMGYAGKRRPFGWDRVKKFRLRNSGTTSHTNEAQIILRTSVKIWLKQIASFYPQHEEQWNRILGAEIGLRHLEVFQEKFYSRVPLMYPDIFSVIHKLVRMDQTTVTITSRLLSEKYRTAIASSTESFRWSEADTSSANKLWSPLSESKAEPLPNFLIEALHEIIQLDQDRNTHADKMNFKLLKTLIMELEKCYERKEDLGSNTGNKIQKAVLKSEVEVEAIETAKEVGPGISKDEEYAARISDVLEEVGRDADLSVSEGDMALSPIVTENDSNAENSTDTSFDDLFQYGHLMDMFQNSNEVGSNGDRSKNTSAWNAGVPDETNGQVEETNDVMQRLLDLEAEMKEMREVLSNQKKQFGIVMESGVATSSEIPSTSNQTVMPSEQSSEATSSSSQASSTATPVPPSS